MKYTIQVTNAHIQNGIKGNCKHCPVALAVMEITHGEVLVGNDKLAAKINDNNHWAYTPDNVNDFVYDFDAGMPVQPFTFEIEL